MSQSSIEWTDETWNPVVGCRKVSAGCANCYAVNMAHRLSQIPATAPLYKGLTEKLPNGKLNWTGEVRFVGSRVNGQPFRWRKPRRVFVNSMSDLFHENFDFEGVFQVYLVMRACERHTFQILTKRPERAAEFYRAYPQYANLPNVWVGASVENQEAADTRIPHLLEVPAVVRFLSCEPLLGAVDLRRIYTDCVGLDFYGKPAYDTILRPLEGRKTSTQYGFSIDAGRIHWVIAGGESGSNARPLHPDWARSLRDQCQNAGVAFFMKQGSDTAEWGGRKGFKVFDSFPADLQIREYPNVTP